MANTTIPNLPAAVSLDGTEQLEVVQNGTSKRVTADQIAALAENTQGTVTQINTGGALVGGPITTTGTILRAGRWCSFDSRVNGIVCKTTSSI